MTALLAPALLFGFLAGALAHLWLLLTMRPLHSVADTLVFSLYLTAGTTALFLVLHLVLALLARARGWAPQRALRLRTGASIFLIAAPLLAASFIVATRPFYIRQPVDLLGFVAMIAIAAGMAWVGRAGCARSFASWMRTGILSLALFFLPLAVYAFTAESRSTPAPGAVVAAPRPSQHVFLLGFDGATWDVMKPLIEQGRLPNFQRVMEQGASGTLWSELAPNQPFQNSASRGMRTPVIWESIATGRCALDHGIWDFYTTPLPGLGHPFPFRVPHTGQRATLSIDGLEPRLWEKCGMAGIDSLVVNWVDSWPAFEVPHCQMISDRAHWQDHALAWPDELARTNSRYYTEFPAIAQALGGQFQPDYLQDPGLTDPEKDAQRQLKARVEAELDHFRVPACEQIAREVLGIEFDPRYAGTEGQNESQFAENHLLYNQSMELDKDRFYLDCLLRMLQQERAGEGIPRLMAFYTSGTDTAQHWFWQFHEPQAYPQVDPRLVEKLGPVIPRVYENADRMLGQILEYADAGTTVVICSDHGGGPWSELFAGYDPFRSGEAHDGYSGNHRQNGIFLAMGPGIRRGAAGLELQIYDIAPLVQQLLGLPVADNMLGQVPMDALDPEYARQYPVLTIPDYGGRQLPPDARKLAQNAGDAYLQQRMDQLGYGGGVNIEDEPEDPNN